MDTNTQSKLISPLLPDASSRGFSAAVDDVEATEALIAHQTTEESIPSPVHRGTTHWLLTTSVLIGDMFGLGCLTLPADFARLGWIPALVVLALFSAIDVYSGVLYTRLLLLVPTATVFDQIADKAMGSVGRGVVYATIYLTILAEPVIFHLTSVESLLQVFYGTGLTKFGASVIVTVLIFPMAQAQHMHDIGFVAILGSVGMLVSSAIVIGKLALGWWVTTTPATTHLVANTSMSSALVGIMDIVFTYGGQVNWMRYISTMKHRHHFVYAVSVCTGVMSFMYVLVGVSGYTVYGENLDLHKPITSLLPQDPIFTRLMNLGLFLHCIIAYQININVWASLGLTVFWPAKAHEIEAGHGHSAGNRSLWASVTATGILASAAISFYFPFFSIVMAIIASLGDFASMVGLPGLFCTKLMKLPRWEVVLIWVMLIVSVVLSMVGVVSSVEQLIQAFIDSRHPHSPPPDMMMSMMGGQAGMCFYGNHTFALS